MIAASGVLVAVAGLVLAATAWGATGLTTPFKATVVSCHDGDTCTFQIRYVDGAVEAFKSRIVGIDTPEVPPKPAECGGYDATKAANELLYPGRPIWLQYDLAAGVVDKYGRSLFIPRFYRGSKPGRTYERTMLLRGLANVYDYRHQKLTLLSQWVAQRNVAMSAVIGSWTCPGPNGAGPSTSIYTGWATGPAK